MNKRSWETLVFSTVGVVAMFIILLGVNLVTARFKQRVDLTAEKPTHCRRGRARS